MVSPILPLLKLFSQQSREMTECFKTISQDQDCRAVIITGNGKHFTAGLDLSDVVQGDLGSAMSGDGDVARTNSSRSAAPSRPTSRPSQPSKSAPNRSSRPCTPLASAAEWT